MRRRDLLAALAAAPFFPDPASAARRRRVRPGDALWPQPAQWEALSRRTGGRLVKVTSPLGVCAEAPQGAACEVLFGELKNPYFIGDTVALTQTSGWVDAWTSAPSAYAVAAASAADVVAAVDFARAHDLRLVVKGGGHDYLGRSSAPDSLLIWTRPMNRIVRHDAFVAKGCRGKEAPQPAVSLGAGALWGHAYNEVTTAGGRYVQGGGCLTVGVAGLVQAGGFGSFSKNFGTAAASLIEAEIVTADGRLLIANRCLHPDLFWALKGGGGGSFGVVTRLTLKTHDLPAQFGIVRAAIEASSDAAFRRLVGAFIAFYGDRLHNPHWGEIVTLRPGRRMEIRMAFQGLEQRQAEAVWQNFFAEVAATPADFTLREPPMVRAVASRHVWDPAFLKANFPGAALEDDRPGAPADNIFWAANRAEAGHVIYAYQSLWLPAPLLKRGRRDALAAALAAAATLAPVELHFQKGLAGGSAAAIEATRDSATNPQVLDAFMLAIIGGEGPPGFPGIAGHAPDRAAARRSAAAVGQAMAALQRLAPEGGCYFAESDFFARRWQDACWGAHYPRLLAIKRRYDPAGLFFVHHGVGSEAWSDDGFERIAL